MNRRNVTIAVAVLFTAALLGGCQPSPTAPNRQHSGAELEPVTGFGKGGKGGGNSGGGSEPRNLTLADGMTGGPEAVPVQNDNKRELNLQGPMTGVWVGIASANCVVMQGDPTQQEQDDLVALLNSGPIDPFRAVMVFDKTKPGAASDKHRLTLNWDQPSGNGTFIVNVTEDVTVVKSGDDYTYSGGYVRVQDKRGRKDSVILRCDNLSTITATVESL